MALQSKQTAEAVIRAHDARLPIRLLLIAWSRCGSWDLTDICFELEALARLAWGDRWEGLLVDLQIHTVPLVRTGIVRAQAVIEAGEHAAV